jgi:ribonuclease III
MEFSAQSSKTLNEMPSPRDLGAEGLSSAGLADVAELEVTLGYRFVRAELLERALTHSSLAHERGATEPEREDNETLEFLGDAVVGMIAAEYVFRSYSDLAEGDLTRLRGALVSRRHLAEVAAELKLGKFLLLGRGEERSGGRTKTALLANAMEAVIGAIYLDAGLEAARKLIEVRVIAPVIGPLREQLTASGGMGDFKSALQELLQAQRQGQPDYRTTGEDGPDHRKQFFVEVRVGGQAFAEGEGRTRKHAEQDAARRAIDKLRGNKLAVAGEAE